MSQRCVIANTSGGTPVVAGCQTGPLSIGTSDATSLILGTNGCTARVTIDSAGLVTINSNDLSMAAGNIRMLAAAANTSTVTATGIIELGGPNASSTNVSLYEVGTRNLFMGNYATTPNVSGTDTIAIGTSAASVLTTANNTISIGNTANASGADSLCIGNNPSATAERAIVIGSADSSSTGVAPTVTQNNSIAIGSANGIHQAAFATGPAATAIGSASNQFRGALASGTRSTAIGSHATASNTSAIALGSGSSLAGGNGPTSSGSGGIAIGSATSNTNSATASGTNAIAIGSSNGAIGPQATATSALAIGSGDGAIAGASAAGTDSIAIGVGASVGGLNNIAIGSSATTSTVNNSLAIGVASSSLSERSICIGIQSSNTAGSNFAISIGSQATTQARNSIAIGGSDTAAGPIASGIGAIAFGGAAGTRPGPTASGVASVAIGSADASFNSASASGVRSVAIGCGASVAQNDTILLGNTGNTAVRVGIGIANPSSKLGIVGVNGTPVLSMDQVNTAIGNAPVWLNPSTSGVAGTPIHYDASNRFFGFTSSERYKQNIRPMSTESDVLYALTPVLYDAKEGHGTGTDIAGFIAEQVHAVDPKLAILNAQGHPENVAYNAILALAIREIQRLNERITALEGE